MIIGKLLHDGPSGARCMLKVLPFSFSREPALGIGAVVRSLGNLPVLNVRALLRLNDQRSKLMTSTSKSTRPFVHLCVDQQLTSNSYTFMQR